MAPLFSSLLDHFGNISLCVWLGQSRDLDAVLACHRIVQRPAWRTGAIWGPGAIAREVTGLLRDRTRHNTMSENAHELGREMVWSNTAARYMRSFELARRRGAAAPRESAAAREFGHVAA